MDELKKRKLIVGIVTVLVLLIMGLIPAILVGAIGYFVFIKPLNDKQLNEMLMTPKEKSVKADVPKQKKAAPEPIKETVQEEVQASETTEEEDPDAWTERERQLNDQLEAIFNGRMYFAKEDLGTLCNEVMESCTSQKRKEAYALIFAKLQLDLMMLQRMFSGLILGDYGVELTENIDVFYFKDKSVKEKNAEFDKLADNFWTYDGWYKIQECGAYTAFQNMWFYALRRPLDQARFEKAKAIYNFYTATMMSVEGGEEVEVFDHWVMLATFACFKEDAPDDIYLEQAAKLVKDWCSCHFVDEYKEQLASGLKWLKLEKAEYAALCSIDELKLELEPRKAELARVYGII